MQFSNRTFKLLMGVCIAFDLLLAVVAEFKILTEGLTIKVNEGITVTLPCQVDGPKIVVKWTKGDFPLYFGTEKLTHNDRYHLDSSTSTLIITNVNSGDADKFHCEVLQNQAAANITHILEVFEDKEPVEILTKARMILARPGVTVQLPCQVNDPEAVLHWRKGNESLYYGTDKLTNDDRYHLDSSTFTLIITNVDSDDADEFHCEVLQNQPANITHILKVKEDNVPIEILIKGQPIEVEGRTNVRLPCQVDDPKAANEEERIGKDATALTTSANLDYSDIVCHQTCDECLDVLWEKGFMMTEPDTALADQRFRIIYDGHKYVIKISAAEAGDSRKQRCQAQKTGISQGIIHYTGRPLKPIVVNVLLGHNDKNTVTVTWMIFSIDELKKYTIIKQKVDGSMCKATYHIENRGIDGIHNITHQLNIGAEFKDVILRVWNKYGPSPKSDEVSFPGGGIDLSDFLNNIRSSYPIVIVTIIIILTITIVGGYSLIRRIRLRLSTPRCFDYEDIYGKIYEDNKY